MRGKLRIGANPEVWRTSDRTDLTQQAAGNPNLDGPWDVADSWLVTEDLLPKKYPNEIIHGY